MSLAKKLDGARERRRTNPAAVRLVRVAGKPVDDDTVVILRKELIVAPRPGFFRRLATAGNKAFAVAFIVIAFTSSNVASYALGDADHQIMETRAKIALMAEADLHPPLVPHEWNRETGKAIKEPTAMFDWSAGEAF